MRLTLLLVCLGLLCVAPATAQQAEHIIDPLFAQGLAMSPLTPEEVMQGGGFAATNVDTLFPGRPAAPAWQACQWHSRYNIAHTPMRRTRRGHSYANAGKRIARNKRGELTLEIITSAEYTHPRRQGEPWPHLLVQQDFVPAIQLGKVDNLVLRFVLRLLYCHLRMDEADFNPALHTAHTPFYLSMRNANAQSQDHGKSLWMGLQSFDYRYPRLADHCDVSWDIGTARYIYQMPPRQLWSDICFADGRWHQLEADIVPHLRQAIAHLRERGLFADSRLEDFVVEGMNFGWECPGTFDAAIAVRGFSLVSNAGE